MAICEKCIKQSVCKLCDGSEIMGCIEFVSLNKVIMNGQPLPDDCEILTREAYADLCMRASKGQEPTTKSETLVSLDVYNQVAKERNIAIQQLHELGYEFGQKIEPTTKNCESCEHHDSHHEVCNYCYKCSLWTKKKPTPKNDLGVSSGLDKNSKKLEKPISKNDLEVDAVSRKEVLNQIFYSTDNSGDVVLGSALRERIARLPSVTPQEPRKGHWIFVHPLQENDGGAYMCSNCETGDWSYQSDYNFCPNCGSYNGGDSNGNE